MQGLFEGTCLDEISGPYLGTIGRRVAAGIARLSAQRGGFRWPQATPGVHPPNGGPAGSSEGPA
eukprot:15438069-Alexandrium_andersonii.AAC.1